MDAGSSNTIRYVSGALVEWSDLTRSECSPPSIEHLEGAFLFVDISGFTSVASRLSQEGGEGVERISEILTDFFGQLVVLVEKEGGVVFGFEGDALMAAWRWDAADPSWALKQCCGCALEIQWKFGGWNAGGQTLKLRVSIGAGEIELVHLGTPTHRCYFLPAGEAVEQAMALVPLANPSEILISDEAWLSVQDICEAKVQKNGAVRLLRLKEPHHRDVDVRHNGASSGNLDCYLPQALRAYLNSALPNWVGERRSVVIAFIKVLFAGKNVPLADLNQMLITIEKGVESLGGEILEVSASKDGLETLCVFGLPAGGVKDIGQHAVLAAIKVRDHLNEKGLSASCGIAKGQVFCGPVGPEHRRQYSVVGAPVYLAARMLSVAAGRILVDEETMASTLRSMSFDGPYPLHLAGIRSSVQCFIPLGPAEQRLPQEATQLVDRESEIDDLKRRFVEAANATEVVVISGEAGIGKTSLISTFADLCDAQILQSGADAIDHVTPYLSWRSIINKCLELEVVESDVDRKKEVIQSLLKKNKDLVELAPLLNDVLDLEFEENWLTANMARDVRAENLKRLLGWIIGQRLESTQSLVILEDAQWMDEGSWRLLMDIVEQRHSTLFIISCRNFHDIQGNWRSELKKSGYHTIDLKRFSKTDTSDFIRKRLKQNALPDRLAQIVFETTEGNPLFIDEICNLLSQGDMPLDSEAAEGEYAIKFPRALEATVRSRIDNLSMDEQLVLKLASVIGTTFKISVLRALAPEGLDLDKAVDTLLSQQLLKSLPASTEDIAFRHQVIRDLVYESLLSAQKQETHASLARFIEAEPSGADAVRLPLLLHHWRCANRPREVVRYLDQVAALRLRQFDNRAAIDLLNECLSLARAQGIELDDDKKASCQLLLGEAYVGNGLMAGGRKSYEEGLRLMGLALPGETTNLLFSLVGEVLRQCWTRLTGPPSTETSASSTERKPSWNSFYMAAQAYEDLTRIYYLGGEKTRLLHAVLRATNLAEALKQCTPALAMNYATLGAICGVIPLRRQAEYYLQRAEETAKLYDEPSVSTVVDLTSGLYRTSLGDWKHANAHFVDGMNDARAIGDKRRWCELAICLETIAGPWMLCPAFSGIDSWEKLVEEIASVGRDREDSHAVGCAVLASLRGNRVLGRTSLSEDRAEAFKELLSRENCELELIHKVEGCAHLAGRAFEKGNRSDGDAWLQKCSDLLSELNPGMKVRTLPALSFLFDACLQQIVEASTDKTDSTKLDLISRVMAKLTHFSRIYPVGKPENLRCKGDFFAIIGEDRKAVKLWKESLRQATKLNMVLAAYNAAERLKRAGQEEGGVARETALDLGKSFPDLTEVKDIVERAVADGAINCLPFSTPTSR